MMTISNWQCGQGWWMALVTLVKMGIDAVTWYWTWEQLVDLRDLSQQIDAVNATNCPQTLCITNVGFINKATKSNIIGDYIILVLLSLALLAALVALIIAFAYCCSEEVGAPWFITIFVSLAFSIITMIAAYSDNGQLWNVSIYYRDDLPDNVISIFESTLRDGAGILVPTSLLGIPCLCIIAYFAMKR